MHALHILNTFNLNPTSNDGFMKISAGKEQLTKKSNQTRIRVNQKMSD